MVDIGLHFVTTKSGELVVVMPAGGVIIIYGSGRNFWDRVGFALSKVYDAGQRYKSGNRLDPFVDDDGVMAELPNNGGSVTLKEHPDKWNHIKNALKSVFDESKNQPVG